MFNKLMIINYSLKAIKELVRHLYTNIISFIFLNRQLDYYIKIIYISHN